MGWFSDSKFAFCRGIANHAWQFPPELGYEAKRLTLTLHCANCGASRKDHVHSGTGVVESRAYHYADGYSLDFSDGRPAKAELRHDGLQMLLDVARKGSVTPLRRTRRRRAA